jgi:hypothetical protein
LHELFVQALDERPVSNVSAKLFCKAAFLGTHSCGILPPRNRMSRKKASQVGGKALSAPQHAKVAAPGLPAGVWWLLFCACIFPVGFRQVSVSDAWWHVAIGRWLVERWSLPDVGILYFTGACGEGLASELRWQWLGDVILYFAHAAMGAVGIQLVGLGCLFVGMGFLALMARGESRGPWALVLLVATAVATYQLQLPRNSVFSLALFPAVLWMGCRRSGLPALGEYAWMGGVLLIWSFLHGSCLVGWVAGFSIFSCRAVAAFLKPRAGDLHHAETCTIPQSGRGLAILSRVDAQSGFHALALWTLAAGLVLALIVAGRDGAFEFLTLPAKRFVALAQGTLLPTEGLPGIVVSSQGIPSSGLKEWLNSTIWQRDALVPWSNDYWSPFDMLPDMRPVEAAILLVVAAMATALITWRVRPALLPAWVVVVVLGAGYVRMFGYAALASAAVILSAFPTQRCGRVVRFAGWIAVGLWLVVSWGAMLSGTMGHLVSDGQHVARWGKVPIYDDATADWLMEKFPTEKVFTTIESGSHCLLRWAFRKPVFLDGFFTPHSRKVWEAYRSALDAGDPAPLKRSFGVTTAVIPSTSERWMDMFLASEEWYPAAVGIGSVVFLHRSIPLSVEGPRMFFTAKDMESTSALYRNKTMHALFRCVTAPNGFPPSAWTSLPQYRGLHELAIKIFPKAE